MALTVHSLTTNYLGADIAIPAGASELEVWGVDAQPATATASVWFKLLQQDGAYLEVLVPAGSTYVCNLPKGSAARYTYNVKATAATPKACVKVV